MKDIIKPIDKNNIQVLVPIKSIIQLTPDNPDLYTLQTTDKDTHLLWSHGGDFYFSLWDLDEWLREQVKYGEVTDSEEEAFEIVRDKIREIMNNHGVNLEMVP
jgi:hypothetical protein